MPLFFFLPIVHHLHRVVQQGPKLLATMNEEEEREEKMFFDPILGNLLLTPLTHFGFFSIGTAVQQTEKHPDHDEHHHQLL
jgi:hypothetical protein